MKLLFTFCAALLLLASCSSDEQALVVSPDDQEQLNDFMVQFAAISSMDNEEIRQDFTDFYELATVNNCDPGNFGIVTPTAVTDYLSGISFSTVRSFHNWTVEYGKTLRNIVSENPEIDDFVVLDRITLDTYTSINGGGIDCGLEMVRLFNEKAYGLANTFGVFVQGSGFREIEENQLFLFGGAFNTFIRTQELERSCNDSTN